MRGSVSLAVSLGILALILVPGLLILRASAGQALGYSLFLVLVFGLPARSIDSVADVGRRWRSLTAWILGGTVLWDGWTAVMGQRPFLSEWPLVYSSSLVVFSILFLLQGALVGIFEHERTERSGEMSGES